MYSKDVIKVSSKTTKKNRTRLFSFIYNTFLHSVDRLKETFVLSIEHSSKKYAFVHSLPFFLIVIYIAIRKFIFSLSAVSDVNFSSWLVVM